MTERDTLRMFQDVGKDVNGVPSLAEVMERCYPPLTKAERWAAALPLNGGNHFGPRNCGEGKDCPHCHEDRKILEERIEAVRMAIASVDHADHELIPAFDALVREIRR